MLLSIKRPLSSEVVTVTARPLWPVAVSLLSPLAAIDFALFLPGTEGGRQAKRPIVTWLNSGPVEVAVSIVQHRLTSTADGVNSSLA